MLVILIRLGGLAAALGCLAVIWALFTKPQIEPLSPSQALDVPLEQELTEWVPDNLDFVDRPLFRRTRRPEVDVEVVATAPVVDQPQQLQGVSLVGVIAAGEVKGVILRKESGEQLRLMKGDVVDGWLLADVEARAATFTPENGDASNASRLDMALASNIQVVDRSEAGAGKGASNNEKSQASGGLTFDSVWKGKAARAKENAAGLKRKEKETKQ